MAYIDQAEVQSFGMPLREMTGVKRSALLAAPGWPANGAQITINFILTRQIYNQASVLKQQIDAMNSAYRIARIRFVLGSVVYEEKYGLSLDKTIAIRLCKAKAIDPGASVNVIIADAISAESNKESVIGTSLQWPWDPPGVGAPCVVVGANTLPGSDGNFNLGYTLVHETGHFLGLYHTFEPNGKADGCEGGDDVKDTPAQANPIYGCPVKPSDSCPNLPGLDPINNFMGYTQDSCMTEFKIGQVLRLQALIAQLRPQLLAQAPAAGSSVVWSSYKVSALPSVKQFSSTGMYTGAVLSPGVVSLCSSTQSGDNNKVMQALVQPNVPKSTIKLILPSKGVAVVNVCGSGLAVSMFSCTGPTLSAKGCICSSSSTSSSQGCSSVKVAYQAKGMLFLAVHTLEGSSARAYSIKVTKSGSRPPPPRRRPPPQSVLDPALGIY